MICIALPKCQDMMKTIFKTIPFETMPKYTRGLFQMRNSEIKETCYPIHQYNHLWSPLFTTARAFHRPCDPVPRDPACVFHLAAFYDTGRERDLGRGSLFQYRNDRLETNDGHEKYSFQIDGLLNLLRSKQSGSEKYYAFFFKRRLW